jgi:hypothetical protein
MHQKGDIVKFKPLNVFGKSKKLPEGIKRNKEYTIVNIHRGIDGAYDWDDLFFEGFGSRKFCEFDFETVKGNS